MSSRKIGIMGGTFNPIHYAHLLLAESAREQYGLDRVIFIPTGIPYMKDTTNLPSGELRYQLVKIAIRDNPYFTCSRLEIDRPGNTYTADTLRELHKMYPGDHLYFIMGADSVMDLEKWHKVEDVFNSTTILAAVRHKVDVSQLEERRKELAEKFQADIELLEYGRMDVSSTVIRDRISKGLSVRYLLPEDCIEFIRTKSFYTEKPSQDDMPSRVYVPEKNRRKKTMPVVLPEDDDDMTVV
ncbi:MAG: nicotinate-nucleotide adenylyltransferase [Lachnospiraceae bacterium]|nr:nicotinate-nucleotide adenylyltransferase [Lachnospiraceae bacterium]